MIDVESKIFNRVHASVAPLCAKNHFVSTYTTQLTSLPAAALFEVENVTIRGRQSSTPVENFARITYQFEAYAKTKSECKKLMNAGDEAMIAMNFSRMSGPHIMNDGNTEVFRGVARYDAEVDSEGTLYRRR